LVKGFVINAQYYLALAKVLSFFQFDAVVFVLFLMKVLKN